MRTVLAILVFSFACFGQAVRFDSVASTTSSSCASGRICPINAIPGATITVCNGLQLTLTACQNALATTYSSYTAGASCAPTAQLTPATGGACISTSDNQGGFGFWITPGQYSYFLRVPASAGGGTYGPYPINAGTSGVQGGYVYDANYQSLQAAVNAASGGILFCTKAWVVSSTLTISTTNTAISASNGCVISANSNSFSLITISGDKNSVSGATLSANGHTAVTGITMAAAASNFSATWNKFSGAGMTAGFQTGYNGSVGNSGVYLAHNRYTGTSQGAVLWNVDKVDVEYETCTNLVNDCIYSNVASHDALATNFPNGVTFSVSHVTGTGLQRMGIEWAGNGYRWISFTHNSFTFDPVTYTQNYCISGGTDSYGGATDQLIGGLIDDNTCYNPVSTYTMSAYGIEAYGHNYTISNNHIKGKSFINGILFDGYNHRILNNTFENIGATTGSIYTQVGIRENPAADALNKPSRDNLYEGNTCINVQSGCLGVIGNGDIARGNHDFRAPGFLASDNGQLYVSFGASGISTSALMEGNYSYILAPVNGFTLPGGFTWTCMNNGITANTGVLTYRDNHCENQNAVAFGQQLYNTAANYNRTQLIGNKSFNLAYLGGQVGGLSGATMQFHDNLSFLGAGSVLTTDFTLGSNLGVNFIPYGAVTGTANAIAGTFFQAPTVYPGLKVLIETPYTLQAGANTFNYNGGGALAIKAASSPGNNISVPIAAQGTIQLEYNGYFGLWVLLGQ